MPSDVVHENKGSICMRWSVSDERNKSVCTEDLEVASFNFCKLV